MIHLILFSICIFSVEIFLRFDFLSILDSILILTKKSIYLIANKNISDHWKEKAIPSYAIKIMSLCIKIILIIFGIFILFSIADNFIYKFIEFAISLFGIIESVIFVAGYLYLRQALTK